MVQTCVVTTRPKPLLDPVVLLACQGQRVAISAQLPKDVSAVLELVAASTRRLSDDELRACLHPRSSHCEQSADTTAGNDSDYTIVVVSQEEADAIGREIGHLPDPRHGHCCAATTAMAVMARANQIGEWEQGQTHVSLLSFLEEEVAEFREAVEHAAAHPDDPQADEELAAELSDLLLQVLFHAEILRRRGADDFLNICQRFTDKLVDRAPYLFDGTATTVDSETQDAIWQEAKRRARTHQGDH